MSKLISTARVLIAKRNQEVAAVAKPGIRKELRQVDGGPRIDKPFGGKNFNCRGPHLIQDCKEPISTFCYGCGEFGHFMRYCLQRNKGEPMCQWLPLQACNGA